MIADYVVGISETPEGLMKQMEKAPEYTNKRTVTTNVRTYAVVVCDEKKLNPVSSNWK